MSSQLATRIIDGDGHIIEDNAGIIAHMETPYREIAQRKGIDISATGSSSYRPRRGDAAAARPARPRWDPRAGSISSTTSASTGRCFIRPRRLSYGKIVSLDYAVAVSRAYNDWLYETYMKFNPRFKGMAIHSDAGSRGSGQGAAPRGDRAGHARRHDAVQRLAVSRSAQRCTGRFMPRPTGSAAVLAVHGGAHDRFGMDHMNMYVPVHALGHPWGLTINCADIVYNGIFDRFPRVRIAFLEGGVAWLLLLLERLHASHETHFQYIPAGEFGMREGEDPEPIHQKTDPRRPLFLGIETEELTMPFAIKIVGNKPFLYSSDFPHEVTNESCKHDLGELMESDEITEDDKAAMLYRNAETFLQTAAVKRAQANA